MADVGEFIATLKIVFEGQGLKEATAQMETVKTKGSALDSVMDKMVFTFGDVMTYGKKLAGALWSVAESAAESEMVSKRLADAMKAQGIYTDDALEANLKYATSLQAVTKYNDEDIASTMQLLTTFGLHDEQLRKTTGATADLASGLGVDLRSATMLMGKAFAGETSALSRYGIVIDDSIPKSQRFEAVMGQLQQRFGGAAKGEADTFTGSIEKLKNTFDDLKENIGKELLPAFKSWSTTLKGVIESINALNGVDNAMTGVTGKNARERLMMAQSELAEINGRIQRLSYENGVRVYYFDKQVKQLQELAAEKKKQIETETAAAVKDLKNQEKTAVVKKTLSLGEIQNAAIAAEEKRKILRESIDYEISIHKKSLTDKKNMLEEQLRAVKKGSDEEKAIHESLAKTISEIDKKKIELQKNLNNEMEKGRAVNQEIFDLEISLGLKSLSDKRQLLTQKLAVARKGSQDEKKLMLEIQKLDKDITAQRLENAQQIVSNVTTLTSNLEAFQTQQIQNNLKQSLESENQKYEDKKAWIEANVTDETDKAAQLDALEKSHSAKVEELNNNAQNEERKRQQAMKPIRIAEAIANTAIGVTKAFAQGGIFGAVTGAIIAAAGAVQIATIQAQQFAKGGRNIIGGMALVGEEGPELVNLPRGSDVYSNKETNAMLSGGSNSSMVFNITMHGADRKYADLVANRIAAKVNRNRKW